VPGAGAIPVLRTCRVGSAALVAPASSPAHTESRSHHVPDSISVRTNLGPQLVPDLDRSEYLIQSMPVPVRDLNRYLFQASPRLRPERR